MKKAVFVTTQNHPLLPEHFSFMRYIEEKIGTVNYEGDEEYSVNGKRFKLFIKENSSKLLAKRTQTQIPFMVRIVEFDYDEEFSEKREEIFAAMFNDPVVK